jgi:hypothetical protein
MLSVCGTATLALNRDAEPFVAVDSDAVSDAVTARSIEREPAPRNGFAAVSLTRTGRTASAAAALKRSVCEVDAAGTVAAVPEDHRDDPTLPIGVCATAVPTALRNPVTCADV